MAGLKIARLKSSTLIENLIALSIISICLSLSLVIIGKLSAGYSRVSHSSWFNEVAVLSNSSIMDRSNVQAEEIENGLVIVSAGENSQHKLIRRNEE